jgi:hypothetical protein
LKNQQAPMDDAFEQLLHLEMEMATFSADWQHCDQVSNYVARMVSHNRSDPIRHSNLLSSILNELLELLFRSNGYEGGLSCGFYRCGQVERIEVRFPCPPDQRRFYETLVPRLEKKEARARYLDSVLNDAEPIDQAILLGLLVNYDADVELCASDGGTLTLTVDLSLERLLT